MDELDRLLHCDEGVDGELDDLLGCDEGVGNELDDLLRCDEGVAIDDVKVDLKELSEMLVFFKEAEVVSTLHGLQNNIDKDKHRRIVQWIVSICGGFLPATFFSCISLFDRTLVKGSITSNKPNSSKLVAATSLLISAKFEEPKKLNVECLLQLMNAEYTRKDVLETEEQILKEVSWRLYSPTVDTFLSIFVAAAKENCRFFDFELECLSRYLSELSLLDCSYMEYLPSQVAASAIFVATFVVCQMRPWSLEMQTFSGYRPSELKDCVKHIHRLHAIVSAEEGDLQKKYKAQEFMMVSTFRSGEQIPEEHFEDFQVP